MTTAGLNDFVKVFISAEFNFFCWLCVSTHWNPQQFSSGLRVDADKHLSSEFGKNVALLFSLEFKTFLVSFHAASLSLCLFLRQILKFWSDWITLMKFPAQINWSERFRFESMRDVKQLSWILHVGLVSASLSSSVRLTTTSAAPYLEKRSTIVVYSVICTQQVRDSTHDGCHASQRGATFYHDFCHGWQQVVVFHHAGNTSSTWLLHFRHHFFGSFTGLFIKLKMCIRVLFIKSTTTLGLVQQAFWRMPLFTKWSVASSFGVILAWSSRHSTNGILTSATSSSRCFSFTLVRKNSEKRWLCHLCALNDIVTEFYNCLH